MGVSLKPDVVLLGKYRIERILGQGGMGTVVCARHLSLDEVVAIKVLSDKVRLSDELAQRFVREARAAAKLKSAHVVRVTDVGQLDDGMPFMVMEMLEGADLAQLVKARGALDPQLAVDLVLQACEVLAEAHAQGIVHRDIKPSNLFATTGNDGAPFIKVLDFGIAKAPDEGEPPITRTLSVLGTPGYMSPEQLRSAHEVDHRTDLWALGVVLYELLEGHRAFDALALPELCVQIAMSPTPALVRAPAALATVVLRCLEKEPEDRYQSIAELARALAPFSADPIAAARDLERMQRLARAGAERIGELTPPPRGRLDSPTALPADIVAATVVAKPLPVPAARAPVTPLTLVAADTATSVYARRRSRRAPIAISMAIVVAAAGLAFVLQLRAEHEPKAPPETSTPLRTMPSGLGAHEQPSGAPPPASAATNQAPVEPVAPVKPVAQAAEVPAESPATPASPPVKAPADEPVKDTQRTHRNPRGPRNANKAAATPRPATEPTAPSTSGSDAGSTTPARGGSGSGSAAPCDPYSRLGC